MDIPVTALCLLTTMYMSCHAARPNIVLIVADDMGWNDVGFHGSEIETPNIDKLAYEGVILNNYYVSPICTPTRGCLMTGRHPIHLGLQHYVISAPEPWGLPLNHTTMAQHLKRLNYSTHIVGKWHLGFFRSEYLPTNRGFDSHFGYWTGKEDYYDHQDFDGYWGLDFRRNLEIVNETWYSTELYTVEALNIIKAHDTSKPLFLYLAHQAVHAGNRNSPLQAPKKYIDRYKYIQNLRRRTFAGMVGALDDSIGEIVSELIQRDMMDNTIIVFSTDNGGPANNYDGNAACNLPLRGTKNTLWEGGVHGVGFVHSKLLKKPGIKTENMVHVSDWLPTFYSAAGGNISELGTIDGIDLWDMIQNNGDNIRTHLLHNIDPIQNFSAIRVGDYKLIQGNISGGRDDGWYTCNPPNSTRGIKSLRYLVPKDYLDVARISHASDTPYIITCSKPPLENYTNCQPSKAACLFHIPSDPCEYNNLADAYPTMVQSLQKVIQEYAATSVKPVNKLPDKLADPSLHGGAWVPWQG